MKELGKMATTIRAGSFRFIFVLIIILLPLTSFAAICPQGDLNDDCKVDLFDLNIFTTQWLDPNPCEEDNCADFVAPIGVDFADFSVFANVWMAKVSPLVINEFMASNNSDSNIHDPAGDYDDWIEIHNTSDINMNLAGMYLTDDLGNPIKWQVPSGYPSQTTVPAGSFIVFWADDETAEGPLHTNFKLSGSGEEIGLFDTDGITPFDTITFGEQATNVSYGRDPCITENWRFFPHPTPGADNNGAYLGAIDDVQFSNTRGFYSSASPFNLTMACPTSGATIYYTTDGRSPISGEVNTPTSKRYTSQITMNSTKIIRAAAIKTGWLPSRTETHSFIFDANSYQKAIPVMAIVGDPNQTLWEPNGVMSVNHRGFGYEKPASLELMDPNNTYNYQINCGLRIHGNARYDYTLGNDWLTCWYSWWDHQNLNKFSFRFYFRSEYGNNRFDYPFFTYTPEVTRQQCVVLRGGKNDSCTPLVKDEFWRRVFKALGGIQLTGRVVNLYINGVYKAYYNPVGRDNAQFFQEWFETDNDFDVITSAGLRDGDWTAWNDFLNYIDTHDLSIPANYDYVAGKFDIPDFIDYLIVQIHSGNFDWPNNNWTIHRERSDNGVFRFTIWDAEGTEEWYFGGNCEKCADTAFWSFPSYDAGKGLNAGTWPICRIYRALKANSEFKQLFADRIHKCYKNNGIMTTANLLTTWNDTVNEIKAVLPAYDGVLPPSFVGTVFLPKREPYVLAAFDANGLFNRAMSAPVFYVNGVNKFGGYVSTSDSFTMTDPCSSGGTIYYTTDGSDPRVAYTGAVSPTAITYSGSFTISKSTDLKARIYKSSTTKWSALNEAVYTLPDVCDNLRITEIMYNPKDTGGPNDANTEYIELKNVGSSTINLNLVRFTKGVDFTFGPNTLAAGQHILVVKDINAFTTKYGAGRYIAGEYSGSLDNAGEKIRLKDANGTNILDFNYADGWRDITDGGGYSLTIINPADSNVNHWGNKDSWRASAYIDGSPGWDDSNIVPNPNAIVINEVLAHSHDVAPDWIELRNTTANPINIGGWFLSNSDANIMKYRFATGTTIPANGYIVVSEDVNFGQSAADPGRLIPFALSEDGDTVCLASALDANSDLTGYRDIETFGASDRGVSFGRYYKASTGTYNFVPMDTNTPGSANAYPKVGPIIFTEIMYNPDWPTNGSYTNNEYEYVELYNNSGSAVTLFDSNENQPWKFTDGIDYTFASPPNAVTIPAGAKIVVVKDVNAFKWRYPSVPTGIIYGPYNGWLANDGEQLELGKPGGVDDKGVRQYIRVERVDYSDGSHPSGEPGDVDLWPTGADGLGKSLTRTSTTLYGNDPNNWTAANPTPGS